MKANESRILFVIVSSVCKAQIKIKMMRMSNRIKENPSEREHKSNTNEQNIQFLRHHLVVVCNE